MLLFLVSFSLCSLSLHLLLIKKELKLIFLSTVTVKADLKVETETANK